MTAANILDKYTDTVMSYVSFCKDACIPSRSRVCFNDDKPWFTARLKRLTREKEAAFRSGETDSLKAALKYSFNKAGLMDAPSLPLGGADASGNVVR